MEVLRKCPAGRLIISEYLGRDEEFITSEERITIIQILCDHIVKTDPLQYFSLTSTKLLWAEAIVKSFPCLETKVTDAQGKVTMNHDIYFYPKAGGFIENKLKEMRRSKGIRKRKISSQTSSTLNTSTEKKTKTKVKKGEILLKGANVVFYESVMVSMVSWLKVHGPSITNKAKIHEYMESTFDYREQQISVTLTSASQIFEEYPRYVDFENGSLILHDFYRKYKDAHFCLETRFFGRFQNALVGLAERKKCLKNISACNQSFANFLDNVAAATIPQSLEQQQQS
ncbi:uncharacterized protein LOC123475647 [Daphnia magna]|uniref:uncharacterized protein LOC123475647 n=1 Tax=Daphnia magna TaxID=35525 RepID=UPI001E1BB9D4|nr:uncharacterized protein LOC123475647 [Daphnia magna]